MRQQRQCDVAVPGVVAPDLVLVETALAFGRFKARLNVPAHASHTHQPIQLGLCSLGKDDVVGHLARILDGASDKQVVAPGPLFRRHLQAP
jgi:hypothetical protein